MLKQHNLLSSHFQRVGRSVQLLRRPPRYNILSRHFSSNDVDIVSMDDTIRNLRAIEKKAIWLSAYIVHNANTIRPKRVGQHISACGMQQYLFATVHFYLCIILAFRMI
jgi:hypothetical protein